MELRKISHKNPFFYKNNRFSREIHTYSETDYIERYEQISIWKFETTCRNDGSRLFDLVVDGVILETLGGEIDTIEKVRNYIDNLKHNVQVEPLGYWEARERVKELDAMDNRSPLDSGENPSY